MIPGLIFQDPTLMHRPIFRTHPTKFPGPEDCFSWPDDETHVIFWQGPLTSSFSSSWTSSCQRHLKGCKKRQGRSTLTTAQVVSVFHQWSSEPKPPWEPRPFSLGSYRSFGSKAEHLVLVPPCFQLHCTCWTFPPSFNMSLKKNHLPKVQWVDTCTQPTGLSPKNQLPGGILNSLVVSTLKPPKPGDSRSRPRSRLRPRPRRLGWLEVEARPRQRPRLPVKLPFPRSHFLSHSKKKDRNQRSNS